MAFTEAALDERGPGAAPRPARHAGRDRAGRAHRALPLDRQERQRRGHAHLHRAGSTGSGPATSARAARVRRGARVTLRYRVDDLTPEAKVRLVVRTPPEGRKRATLRLGWRGTNTLRAVTWRCTLAARHVPRRRLRDRPGRQPPGHSPAPPDSPSAEPRRPARGATVRPLSSREPSGWRPRRPP